MNQSTTITSDSETIREAYLQTGDDLSIINNRLDAEDRALLSSLHPSDVQGWALTRIKECMELVRAFKTVHNAAALINRMLPPEVLIMIFGLLNPGGRPERQWYNSNDFSALHVCRLWRYLLFRTTAFWADALSVLEDVEDSRFDLFLSLSGSEPLSLCLRGLPVTSSHKIIRNSHRITSFELYVENSRTARSLNAFLDADTSHLESLVVHHDEDRIGYSSDMLDNFHDMINDQVGIIEEEWFSFVLNLSRLPLLRTLELPWTVTHYALTGTSNQLHNLTLGMCIQCHVLFPEPFEPSETLFWTTLQAFPELRHLEINSIDMVQIGQDEVPSPPSLPNLRTLRFYSQEDSFVRYLLSRMPLPPSCCVEPPDGAGESFRSPLPENLASFPPIASADEVELQYDDISTLITRSKGSSLLKVGAVCHDIDHLFEELTEMFAPFRAVTTLRFRVAWNMIQAVGGSMHALELLAALPQLRCLDVTACDGRCDMLSLLGTALPEGGFPCPLLEEVRVEGPSRSRVPRYYDPHTAKLNGLGEAIAEIVELRKGSTAALKLLQVNIHSEGREESDEGWEALAMTLKERLGSLPRGTIHNIVVQFDSKAI